MTLTNPTVSALEDANPLPEDGISANVTISNPLIL